MIPDDDDELAMRAHALQREVQRLCIAHTDSLPADVALEVQAGALGSALIHVTTQICDRKAGRPVPAAVVANMMRAGPWLQLAQVDRVMTDLLAKGAKP